MRTWVIVVLKFFATVREQNLCLSTDQDLLKTCFAEKRCLVSLDLEFSNPLRFKPTDNEGIAVLRLPRKPARNDLYDAIITLVGGLSQSEITKKLWIVQRGKIREYQSEG
jgi:hypothetical protein